MSRQSPPVSTVNSGGLLGICKWFRHSTAGLSPDALFCTLVGLEVSLIFTVGSQVTHGTGTTPHLEGRIARDGALLDGVRASSHFRSAVITLVLRFWVFESNPVLRCSCSAHI